MQFQGRSRCASFTQPDVLCHALRRLWNGQMRRNLLRNKRPGYGSLATNQGVVRRCLDAGRQIGGIAAQDAKVVVANGGTDQATPIIELHQVSLDYSVILIYGPADGRSIQNVLPVPTTLSTPISPPINSTSFL